MTTPLLQALWAYTKNSKEKQGFLSFAQWHPNYLLSSPKFSKRKSRFHFSCMCTTEDMEERLVESTNRGRLIRHATCMAFLTFPAPLNDNKKWKMYDIGNQKKGIMIIFSWIPSVCTKQNGFGRSCRSKANRINPAKVLFQWQSYLLWLTLALPPLHLPLKRIPFLPGPEPSQLALPVHVFIEPKNSGLSNTSLQNW